MSSSPRTSRLFRGRVAAIADLTPSFRRFTFAGDDLADFGDPGLDQRIKVIFATPTAGLDAMPTGEDWYDRWRELPVDARPVFRTYTTRYVRREAAGTEVDVDMVAHEVSGPASEWIARARVGDEVMMWAPTTAHTGVSFGIDFVPPARTGEHLLVGDETAAPAICSILESLDPRCDVDAFIEVPTADDALAPSVSERVRLRWLPRDDAEHGANLIDSVTAWTAQNADVLARASAPRPQTLDDIDVDHELLWDSPEDAEGEFYAWMAGEAATIKLLRRLLVSGCGVDRKRVAFMGYWRNGQAERTE